MNFDDSFYDCVRTLTFFYECLHFFTNFDEHLTFGLANEELNLTEIIVKLLLERGFLFFGLMIIFERWPFGLTGIFLLIVALFWDKIRPYFEPKKNL